MYHFLFFISSYLITSHHGIFYKNTQFCVCFSFFHSFYYYRQENFKQEITFYSHSILDRSYCISLVFNTLNFFYFPVPFILPLAMLNCIMFNFSQTLLIVWYLQFTIKWCTKFVYYFYFSILWLLNKIYLLAQWFLWRSRYFYKREFSILSNLLVHFCIFLLLFHL